MENIKKELGQFYSKNKELVEVFLDEIEKDDIVIDPFAGEWDLLNLVKNEKIGLDIDPKNSNTIKNNSLINVPSYKGKFILTNPPYLSKNKTKEKSIFELYSTDDLYKAFLISLEKDAEKGIVILPATFWFNENSKEIRKRFLSKFKVKNVNIFNKQMFEDTTYTVCSFYFKREQNNSQEINFNFIGKNEGFKTLLYNKENDYSIIKVIENMLLKYPKKIKITRYTNDTQVPTNMFLNCIDNSKNIFAEFKEPYKGIKTDRAFLTFCIDGITLSEEEEKKLIEEFNNTLNSLREQYMDSFLSNYRNGGRKRIGFNFSYKLLEHCLVKIHWWGEHY